jgi:hypothetical protein
VSARLLLIALSALAVGCAGRALRQPGVAAPPRQIPAAEPGALAAAQPETGESPIFSGAEHGTHGPPAFPEIRGSSAAVAGYTDADSALDAIDEAPPDEGAPTPSPSPAPLIVEVPEGVAPWSPSNPPAPSVLPPPPFRPPPRAPAPRYNPLPPPRVTMHLPGGEACLKKLALAGVAFQPLDEIRGVETPIQIQSAIGGIRYHSGFGPMVSDCRFALALATAAPELTALGVSEMHFSGAYSYRTSRVGRLSLHAYGLALDVHEIVVAGRRLSVERDFARGIGCGVGPALNRVACKLRDLGLFRELLTPDYNADHNNHFHLGVAPLGPLANELWAAKRPTRHPSPQLPVFGNGSRRVTDSSDVDAKPAGKSTRDRRDGKTKLPEKARPVDERRKAAKRDDDSEPASKAKREQTGEDRAPSKRASREVEQEPQQTKSARVKSSEQRDEKPAAKARKRQRNAKAEKHQKQKPMKAAKRGEARDDKGSS